MDKENNLYKLSQDFFFTFARFEAALKMIGFYRIANGNVEPDWTTFAKNVQNLFLTSTDKAFTEAIDYIEKSPPKKQVEISPNTLEWVDALNNQNPKSDKILIYVRRVRNNLFHGGKFAGRMFSAPERSEILIKHSLTILNYCLANYYDLNEAFNSK